LLSAPDGLKRIWFSTDAPSQYFPLVYTMFRVEYALWKLDPLGYHAVNVLLHGLNAVVLWRLLARLRIPGCWLAAAIFALHPVQVESVAWVTEGKNTLSTLLSLATLWFWLTGVETTAQSAPGHYLASLGLYAAALFAKTTACTLPAAQVLILWWRRRLGLRPLLGILPFLLFGIGMGLFTVWWEGHHQGTRGSLFALTPVQAVLVAGRAVFFYLGKLFWPWPLVFSYPRFAIDGRAPEQWTWPLLCVALGVGLFAARGRIGRAPFAAFAFFVASLSPVLGFIPLYTFRYTYVADHYQYVASIGPITLFAAGAVRLAGRISPTGRRLAIAAASALLATLGMFTFLQSRAYRDIETLWRDTLAKNPGSWMAHHNLGNELLRQQRWEEAIESYRRALEVRPDLFLSQLNAGKVLSHIGRDDEAAPYLERAATLDPSSLEAHELLGRLDLRAGKPVSALGEFRELIRLAPDRATGHELAGRALERMGRRHEALEEYWTMLRLDPQRDTAIPRLVRLLAACQPADSPDVGQAVRLAENANARTEASNPELLAALAAAYAAAGRFPDARAAAHRALALAPSPSFEDPLDRELAAYEQDRVPCEGPKPKVPLPGPLG